MATSYESAGFSCATTSSVDECPETGKAASESLLQQLDRWMQASGFGEDHPWRLAISRAPACCGAAPSSRVDQDRDALLSDISTRLRRARVVAEAAAAMLRELRGVQIDRHDMIEMLDLIEGECAGGLSLVAEASADQEVAHG